MSWELDVSVGMRKNQRMNDMRLGFPISHQEIPAKLEMQDPMLARLLRKRFIPSFIYFIKYLRFLRP